MNVKSIKRVRFLIIILLLVFLSTPIIGEANFRAVSNVNSFDHWSSITVIDVSGATIFNRIIERYERQKPLIYFVP